MDELLELQISAVLGSPILKTLPLSGGDISTAYLLRTETGQLFCKVHKGEEAHSMFLAEKVGLEAISRSGVIKAPEVVSCNSLQKGACLIMEYIPSKIDSPKDMRLLGHQLAGLHSISSVEFGFSSNNFIGSLLQSNKAHLSWVSFYVQERLLPQFQIAKSKNLLSEREVPDAETLEKILGKYFPEVTPSLLHGDLWSGNYLIASSGTPYLIDPAVYYGHSEVDLAMTRLFGGFDSSFYSAYEEIIPRGPGYVDRQALYQLYYLLVHLNLFGRSYYGTVLQILKRYFK